MNLLYRGNDREWREAALAEVPSGSRVLEVGAGTGRTERLGSPAESHVSLDVSRRMLSQGDHMDAPVEGDVHDLPFGSESFECVLAVLLFSTRIDQESAIREMARVCEDGGRIVLVDKFAQEAQKQQYLDKAKTILTYPLAFDFDVQIEEISKRADLTVTKRKRLPNDMNLAELVVIEC